MDSKQAQGAEIIPFDPYLEAYRYAVRVMVEEFAATDPEEIRAVALEFSQFPTKYPGN